MSEFLNPEQPSQNILSNVSAESITTGDIIQIYKIVVNLDRIPKPQGIPQNIASSSTDKFVGRERDLENLNQQLQRNNQAIITAVKGMGGVGKTELAIQYSLLNLQLEAYPGGICWIRAREQDVGLQIVNFARTDLDLNPPDDLELPDRVRWCWKRWREGNTLIVLAESLYKEALNISRKVLGVEHPALATSLNNLAALYYAQGKYIEAKPLYLEALAILEERIGKNNHRTNSIRRNYEKLKEKLNEHRER